MTRAACLFAVLALACWPAAVGAAPARVISGEHPGFSRLVVYLPPDAGWRLGRVAGGYELRADAPDGYDLSDVWRLIPRDRIAALEDRADGKLFLSVDCDCHASAFSIPQGLVVDVVDGPAPPTSPFEGRIDRPVRPAGPLPVLPALPGVTLPAVDEAGEPAPAPAPMPSAPDPAVVAEAGARIAEQLGRAASQGLVTMAPASTTQAPVPARPRIDPHPPLSDHIRIETVVDRDRPDAPPPAPVTETGADCTPADRLDLAAWHGDGRHDLALYPARLVDAFDRPDPAAIRDAARHAIALGFGAEARALLGAFNAEIPDAALLDELARLVDGKTRPAGTLAPQIACDGPSALWAVLARNALRPGDPVATAAVVTAFSALPPGLRRSLGPDLVSRFLDIGDLDTATTLRNAIMRAAPPDDPLLGLLSVEMDEPASGAVDTGLARLREIADGAGPGSAKALAGLIARIADEGAPMPADLALRAGILAAEHRGTPLGTDLFRAHVRALVASGRPSDALDALESDGAAAGLTAAENARLRTQAFAAVADDPSTLASLLPRLVAGLPDLGSTPASDTARGALAEALIDSGLPALARQVLASRPGALSADDRVLLARAHLAEGEPEAAVARLAGLEDSDAAELRARALLAAGAPDAAARLYERLGAVEEAGEAAWRAGDLSGVASLTESERANAAELLAAPLPALSEALKLDELDALVTASARRRSLLAGLLSPP